MSPYEEQKKQLAKSAKEVKPGKRKTRKVSQSKLKRRNIQEDKPMFNTMRGVEQVKAKVPARQSKDLREKRDVTGEGNEGQVEPNSMAQMSQLKKRRVQSVFLEALEKTFSVAKAAKHAGISRRTVYRWREDDVEFGAEWDDRKEAHLDEIEDAMKSVAVALKLPFHATLALGLLNAHRSELYSPKHRMEHTGPGGGVILMGVMHKIKGMNTDTLRQELGKLLGPALVQPGEESDKE